MKKWPIVLVVAFVFAGCGQPKTVQEKTVELADITQEVVHEVVKKEIPKAVAKTEAEKTAMVKSSPAAQDQEVAVKKDPSKTTASISGTVRYDGEIPKFKEIKMDADPICLTAHSNAVFPQTLVLGEGKTMGNVFVQVKGGLPKKTFPTPTEPVVLDQKGCMYDPHVFGVMVGQPVKILNPDGTLHNVHALSKKNPEFNLAMPKFRKETTKTFEVPEFMFPIKCDVHPWMITWATVMAHPYFDTTQVDGQFVIDDLPPGNYEVEFWHEKLGRKSQKVVLGSGESAEINISFAR